MSKKTKKTVSIDPNLTLAQLGERYLDHMEKDGKSVGTCFSYTMELKTAISELGADTLVSAITPEQIDAFNNSTRVTKLKSGRPKAQPSIDKTRRVIRLALCWAEQSGLIEKAPIVSRLDAAVAVPEAEPSEPKKSRKARVVVEAPTPEPVEVETPAA